MYTYRAPLRDIRFVVHDVLDFEENYRAYGREDLNRELLEGLIALRIPRRTASLCYLIVRSISSVSEETRRLMRARDSRGRPKGLRAVRVAGAMSGDSEGAGNQNSSPVAPCFMMPTMIS